MNLPSAGRLAAAEMRMRISPTLRRLPGLAVGVGFGGQSEMKTGAAGRVVGGPQAAAMGFHYGAADAKSHACAVRLGGEKRVEDLVRVLLGKPYAGIGDRDHKLLILAVA
jgi:hypothetical protein